MTNTARLNMFDPAFRANPYPVYARMRQDAPIARVVQPNGSAMWLVTRYADVMTVLKDDRFVKDYRNVLTPEERAYTPRDSGVFAMFNRQLLSLDPPDHTRLRGLVSKAFTPGRIEELRPRIQQIADDLIDAVQDRGQMELISQYAFPLPITVISEMLGIPLEDRDKFRAWSNDIVGGVGGDPEMKLINAGREFAMYLYALLQQRRHQPGNDLISALIMAGEAGDKLTEEELLAMVFLLIVAGHETTVNLIGNGVLALLQHPDQMALLQNDPALLKPAIEEMLRYNGSVETSTVRFTREDVAIGGTVIPRRQAVLAVLASADHDPTQFENPDDFNITREHNRHVAFGHGIHYCLGAPLARLEGTIAIGTLLRRLPELHLAVDQDQLMWRSSLLVRGLQTLPVAW